jgi:hypothetical protein
MCVFEDFIIMKNCQFSLFNYTIEIYNFRMTPNLILSSFDAPREDGEIMEILWVLKRNLICR